MLKKISLFLVSIAPGIFLIGYNIGTGSVTTAASTGASYGMTLVWPLLLSCVFTYILIVFFGRFTAVTGKTALISFRKHFGFPVAAFVLISVVFSEWVAFMGVMGVVTESVKEWSRPLTASGEGIDMLWSTIAFGGLIYFLFWRGRQRFFESVLMIFVGLMGLSFVLTMLMVIPDPWDVIRAHDPASPAAIKCRPAHRRDGRYAPWAAFFTWYVRFWFRKKAGVSKISIWKKRRVYFRRD